MNRREILKKFILGSLFFPLHTFASSNEKKKDSKVNTYLMITFKVKPKKLESFLELIEKVKVDLPQVDGCMGIEVYQSNDDKYTIQFVEIWQSIEQHKKHIEQVVKSGDWDYISAHLENDPLSQYYNEI